MNLWRAVDDEGEVLDVLVQIELSDLRWTSKVGLRIFPQAQKPLEVLSAQR